MSNLRFKIQENMIGIEDPFGFAPGHEFHIRKDYILGYWVRDYN